MVLVALVMVAMPAVATAKDCPQTTLGDIEDEVMCPVCGTPLGLASESPQAQRERAYIERLIAQCRSKDEVKRALVAEFGDSVLALPGDEGDTGLGDVLVYVVPALGIVLAAAGIAFAVIRWRRPRRQAPGAMATRRRRPARGRHGALRPVIADQGVDATIFAAFAVGFVSFVSPCVLPLVPGYLSTISGVSFADIQEGRGRAQVLGAGPPVLPRVHGHVRGARHDRHRPRPDAAGPPRAAPPDLRHHHRGGSESCSSPPCSCPS